MKPEDDCCFDWKKAIKEWEDEHKIPIKEYKQHCPHCGRCPTCGRKLWLTPHGIEPCHPPYYYHSDPGFPGWQTWSIGL